MPIDSLEDSNVVEEEDAILQNGVDDVAISVSLFIVCFVLVSIECEATHPMEENSFLWVESHA